MAAFDYSHSLQLGKLQTCPDNPPMIRHLTAKLLRRVSVTALVADVVAVLAAVAVVAELVSRWWR